MIETRKRWLLPCLMAVLLVATGCFDSGGAADKDADSGIVDATHDAVEDASPPVDTGAVDSGERDSGGTDSGQTDTSVGSDSEGGGDTGPVTCDQGETRCGDGCVDTSSSLDHCGGCDAACTPAPNQEAVCTSGDCELSCQAGFVDNNGEPDDGCELECTPSNGGVEICDGADNDCDGEVDEDDADDAATWYDDSDGDGYGDATMTTTACDEPAGYVANDTDCDPADGGKHTELTGYVDQDGDSWTVGPGETLCTDGTLPDGYASTIKGGDCDDNEPAAHPENAEICDDIDNNCNGWADIDAHGARGHGPWWVDCDGDGYPADGAFKGYGCGEPSYPDPATHCPSSSSATASWTHRDPVTDPTIQDCLDTHPDVYPGQQYYYENPIPGLTGNAAWDYNCNTYAEKKNWAIRANCTDCTVGKTPGWTSSTPPPNCGDYGDFQYCGWAGFPPACRDDIAPRKLACR